MSDNDFQRIARYSGFAPRIWVDDLRAEKLQVQEVESTGIFEDFDVLVNPFGERYLESDVGNMRNLKQIKKFVQGGGVFVNTGGLAFYYMYDPKSNVEGFTGPMFEFLQGGVTNIPYQGVIGAYKPSTILEPRVLPESSSLIDTWLFRTLGIRITLSVEKDGTIQHAHKDFADILPSDSKMQEFRAIERCESTEAVLVPIFKSEYQYVDTGQKHECYPIGAVRYGLGYFIICGIILTEERHKTLIERTIVRACSILAERGRLEGSAPLVLS